MRVKQADSPPSSVASPVPAVPKRAKIVLYCVSQPGCVPCRQLKQALAEPSLREVLADFDVRPVDARDPIVAGYGVQVESERVPNYGIDVNRLSNRERVSINGREVHKQSLLNSLIAEANGQASAIPDDRSLLSLTIVGKPHDRQVALKGLNDPEFERFRTDVLVQEYEPDDVMVNAENWGGPTNGKPSILLQRPNGQALYGSNDYRGKETWLAFAKADPNFKPEDVPGLGGSVGEMPQPLIATVAVIGVGLGAILTIALLRKRV